MNPREDLIARIRARRALTGGRKRRSGYKIRFQYPLAIERDYSRFLVRRWKNARRDMFAWLKQAYPALLAEAGQTLPTAGRTDGFSDDIKRGVARQLELFLGSVPTIETAAQATALRVSAHNGEQWNKALRGVMGVDIFQAEPWLAEVTAVFADNNAGLIKSIAESNHSDVAFMIRDAVMQGMRYDDLIGQLANKYDITERRARLIARDQTTKLNSNITQFRSEGLGLKTYQWQTVEDERVRPTHRANNEEVFSWDKPPKATGHPGHDIQCRCLAIPTEEEIFRLLDGSDGTTEESTVPF